MLLSLQMYRNDPRPYSVTTDFSISNKQSQLIIIQNSNHQEINRFSLFRFEIIMRNETYTSNPNQVNEVNSRSWRNQSNEVEITVGNAYSSPSVFLFLADIVDKSKLWLTLFVVDVYSVDRFRLLLYNELLVIKLIHAILEFVMSNVIIDVVS